MNKRIVLSLVHWLGVNIKQCPPNISLHISKCRTTEPGNRLVINQLYDSNKIIATCNAQDYEKIYSLLISLTEAELFSPYGSTAVSTATNWLIERKFLPRYGTEIKNIASIQTAKKLGYTFCSRHLVV